MNPLEKAKKHLQDNHKNIIDIGRNTFITVLIITILDFASIIELQNRNITKILFVVGLLCGMLALILWFHYSPTDKQKRITKIFEYVFFGVSILALLSLNPLHDLNIITTFFKGFSFHLSTSSLLLAITMIIFHHYTLKNDLIIASKKDLIHNINFKYIVLSLAIISLIIVFILTALLLQTNSEANTLKTQRNIALVISLILISIIFIRNTKTEKSDKVISYREIDYKDNNSVVEMIKQKKKSIIYAFASWVIVIIILTIIRFFSYGNLIESFVNIIEKNYIILNVLLAVALLVIFLKDFFGDVKDKLKGAFNIKIIIIIGIIVLAQSIYYSISVNSIDNIDSDEARLLYDGYLVEHNNTPYKDFRARAPTLIYIMSQFEKILSPNMFEAYRYMLIPIIILSGILIYILSYLLFKNYKISLIAYLLYGFSPLIPNMLYIKTETIATLVVLLGIIIFWMYIISRKKEYLVSSGIVIGLSHGIREVSFLFAGLFILMLIAEYLLQKNTKEFISRLFLLIVPWFIFAFSFDFIITLFKSDHVVAGGALSILKFGITQIDILRLNEAQRYISTYIIIPLLFFIYYIIKIVFTKKADKTRKYLQLIQNSENNMYARFFIGAGFIILFLGYAYNLLRNSFWGEYWMEFMPFFAVMGAVAISDIYFNVEEKIKNGIKFLLILLIISFLFALISNSYFVKSNLGLYSTVTVLNVREFMSQDSDNYSIMTGDPIYAYILEKDNMNLLSHPYYRFYEEANMIQKQLELQKIEYVLEDVYTREWYKVNPDLQKYISSNYEDITSNKLNALYSKNRIKIYKIK